MTENKLICPICKTPLDYSFQTDKVCGCPKCRNIGNIDLWQELDRWKQSAEDHQQWLRVAEKRLETTRKALDVAIDALNTIKGKHDPRCAVYHIDEKTAYDALEQINEITKGGK